jgi:hypothetical protein
MQLVAANPVDPLAGEPIDNSGLSVIIFKTKEHAEAAVACPVPPLPGVAVLTIDIREVYASA